MVAAKDRFKIILDAIRAKKIEMAKSVQDHTPALHSEQQQELLTLEDSLVSEVEQYVAEQEAA